MERRLCTALNATAAQVGIRGGVSSSFTPPQGNPKVPA
jgi:hypothetical protein